MNYLSVCSGIEAASVAWAGLGWDPVGFSEIDRFPSAVLSTRFPDVPNFGDLNNHAKWSIKPGTVDLVIGGTPCQSFSLAGLRGGLADPRGNLALVYLGMVDRLRPCWIVWENVPGVLSSGRGRDFGSFIGALGQLGYGFAWRVMDAQFWGVAQRRRRVFVVGYLGTPTGPGAVLFDGQGGMRNYPPRRKAGPEIAADTCPCLTSSGRGVERIRESRGQDPVIAVMAHGQANAECLTDNSTPTLTCNHEVPIIAGTLTTRHDSSEDGTGRGLALIAQTLTRRNAATCQTAGNNPGLVNPIVTEYGVRRLTPVECERLQGFPDNWTLIDYKGKPAADNPRYHAIGNSMAVPVIKWIGERIQRVDHALNGGQIV